MDVCVSRVVWPLPSFYFRTPSTFQTVLDLLKSHFTRFPQSHTHSVSVELLSLCVLLCVAFVLVRVFIVAVKHHEQKASRDERLFSAYTFTNIASKKSGQKLKHGRSLEAGADGRRPWSCAASWLAPHDLLSLLSYRTRDHQPRGGPSPTDH